MCAFEDYQEEGDVVTFASSKGDIYSASKELVNRQFIDVSTIEFPLTANVVINGNTITNMVPLSRLCDNPDEGTETLATKRKLQPLPPTAVNTVCIMF